METYKTILAPNAPWPVYVAPTGRVRDRTNPEYRAKYLAKRAAEKALKGPPRPRTSAAHINANFERWLNSLETKK
jgi:hypothetical protein